MNELINILFCIYIFLIPLIPSDINGKNYSNYIQVVLFAAVILFVLETFRNKGFRGLKESILTFFSKKIYIAMMILLALMVISAAYASDRGLAIKESMRFLSYILVMYMISVHFNERENERVVYTLIFTTFIVSILGIGQYFTGIGAQVFLQSLLQSRVQATMDNPNTFGAYEVLMFFPLISAVRVKYRNKIMNIFIGLTTVLAFINVVLSMSRSALIGFGIGLVMLFLIFGKKVLILLVPVFGGILMLPNTLNRIKQFSDINQNESRIKIWKIALKMINDHPIGGIGNGNFITNYPKYVQRYPMYKEDGVDVFPSHNSYLKVGSELGVVGEITFVAILLLILKEAFSFLINKKNMLSESSIGKYFTEGFVVVIIPFLVMNCFDNILFVPKAATFFWIMVALLFSHREKGTIF